MNRKETEKFLTTVVQDMDDLTLKKAAYAFASSWSPLLFNKFVPAPASDTVIVNSEEAMQLRCHELENGESLCDSDVCDHCGGEIEEFIEAAKRGVAQRSYSHEPYVPPPRVSDAEEYWPFMRCKNVARALQPYFEAKPLPRSHHALLEHIATQAKVSVEVLKKTSARTLFKNNFRVMNALGNSRW